MSSLPDQIKSRTLISDPFLMGPVFERAVIYMVDHSEEGSMGFILNQPTYVSVGQAVPKIQECKFPVYYGGPVDDNILFFIHTLGDQITNSIEVQKGIYWGGDFEEISDLILNGTITEKEIKFFVGYSGWGEKQLEEEFNKDSWLMGEIKTEDLFSKLTKEFWNESLEKSKTEYSFLSKFAHTPSLN